MSGGVLLQDARKIRSVAALPWLIIPALFVVVTVLPFNFVGDGLRDAADSLQVTRGGAGWLRGSSTLGRSIRRRRRRRCDRLTGRAPAYSVAAP